MVDGALRNISKCTTKSTYAEWKLNRRFNARFVKRPGIAVRLGNYVFPSFIPPLRNNGRRETLWIVAPNHGESCSSIWMLQRWIWNFSLRIILRTIEWPQKRFFVLLFFFTMFSREKDRDVSSLWHSLFFSRFSFCVRDECTTNVRRFHPMVDYLFDPLCHAVAMNYAKII